MAELIHLRKVLACITRSREPGGLEILTFTRTAPQFGYLEWPGGTVEPGETLHAAVLREVQEEAGLTELRIVRQLGELSQTHPPYQIQRHIFLLELTAPTPAAWEHVVGAGEDEIGQVFSYVWLPLSTVCERSEWLGEWLQQLNEATAPGRN